MSQPAVLSVVTGQSGVSVSSVCDGVVLASSVLSLGAPILQAFNNWAPGFVPELEAYYVSCYGAKETWRGRSWISP